MQSRELARSNPHSASVLGVPTFPFGLDIMVPQVRGVANVKGLSPALRKRECPVITCYNLHAIKQTRLAQILLKDGNGFRINLHRDDFGRRECQRRRDRKPPRSRSRVYDTRGPAMRL